MEVQTLAFACLINSTTFPYIKELIYIVRTEVSYNLRCISISSSSIECNRPYLATLQLFALRVTTALLNCYDTGLGLTTLGGSRNNGATLFYSGDHSLFAVTGYGSYLSVAAGPCSLYGSLNGCRLTYLQLYAGLIQGQSILLLGINRLVRILTCIHAYQCKRCQRYSKKFVCFHNDFVFKKRLIIPSCLVYLFCLYSFSE